MKFSTYVALVGSSNAAKVMNRDSNPLSMLNLATTDMGGEPLELAQAESKLMTEDVSDYEHHAYQYPVQEQNFNGILGMLGTPTSMTDALHMQMNQIHFNERVMRQIRAIVEDTPELIETLCATDGDECSCSPDDHSTDANILYGAITDEGKIDYMLGFAQDLADPSGKTLCSSDVFGDPVPDADKYCWCQTWQSDHVDGGHHDEQLQAAADAAHAAEMAEREYKTVQAGNSWSGIAQKTQDDVAYCRCHTPDYSEGISICNSGCGDPNTVCNDDFGCEFGEKGCNNQKCTCKPDGISTNTMTYDECHDQCEAIGMTPLVGPDSIPATQGTGCGIDGQETWVFKEEL